MAPGIYPPSPTFGLRHLQRSQSAIDTSLERLSTGKRINRASDDPAGMIAVNGFKARQITLEKVIERLEISSIRLGVKDAAIGEIQGLVQELNGLVVTAANSGALDRAEREGLQIQADSILETIDLLALTTGFSGEQLISEFTSGSIARQSSGSEGDEDAESATLSLASLRSGGRLNLFDGDLEKAQEVVKNASESLSSTRGGIGNKIRQNESLIEASFGELIGVTDALSQIEDTDYAKETGVLVRNQVLQQATLRSIQMARDLAAESVLSLLESVKIAS